VCLRRVLFQYMTRYVGVLHARSTVCKGRSQMRMGKGRSKNYRYFEENLTLVLGPRAAVSGTSARNFMWEACILHTTFRLICSPNPI
jgi:hypothetical protein